MEGGSSGFGIDVSSDGAVRLRETIKNKLSEFMGTYTDDVLAEYVVVLVCHGKHQDQAKKDLDAFLGEHSSEFVTWLWDHIASNMQDYATSSHPSLPVDINEKNCSEDVVKKNSEKHNMNIVAEIKPENDIGEPVSTVTHKEMDERPIKVPGMLRRRKWTPLNNSSRERKETPRQHTEYEEINDSSGGQHSHSRGKSGLKRRRSLEPWTRRGRSLHDESHADKRSGLPSGIHAPRRILQSAVREAVGPIGSTDSKRFESSKKRLRSVVSKNVENSNALSDAVEASNRPKALAKSLPAMAIAVKAAAAAAQDVANFKSTGSVFERLGHKLDSSLNGLHEIVEEHMPDDEGNNNENTMKESVYQGHKYQHRSEIHNRLNRGLIDDVEMMDRESVMPSEDARYTRRYGGASIRRKKLENRDSDGVSRISTSKDRPSIQVQKPDKLPEESVTVQYRVAQKSQETARESRVPKTSSKTPTTSREIVNISVNVNTWKPSHFQRDRDAVAMKTKASNLDSNLLQDHAEMHTDGTFPDVTDMGLRGEAGKIAPASDPNSASNADNCSDIRKGTSASGVCTSVRTLDDADSRTVFVSNVHFAAIKEALSKHFTRCGEVIKVIIQTDAGSSQPKGSAYIEFASKEMADMALALDETSFMSRMLKVMRKSASNVEHTILPRPPLRRPLPFLVGRPTRAIYPRGFPSAYRRGYLSRPFGSRSLQWRRDKTSGTSDNLAGSSNESLAATSPVPLSGGNLTGPISSQSPRPLTYIRNAVKLSDENASQVQE